MLHAASELPTMADMLDVLVMQEFLAFIRERQLPQAKAGWLQLVTSCWQKISSS